MKFNHLTPEEEFIILQKGTEPPFSGKYYEHKENGTYICKRCDTPLFNSNDKFDAQCGWPSFDDEIKGAIKRIPDADGVRTEIVCVNCSAHLGHVFSGEGFTEKNTRHCVNSISLSFVSQDSSITTKEKAIFASGCFWGTEYMFQNLKGVLSTTVGYIDGSIKNPTYEQVCSGTTGHAEAVEIVYDASVINYETLAKLFFETHDPTQLNRQGPDIGTQYRSEIFYFNEKQKEIAQRLIKILKEKGYDVVTKLTKATEFYVAEKYHQEYYKNNASKPYCHAYKPKF